VKRRHSSVVRGPDVGAAGDQEPDRLRTAKRRRTSRLTPPPTVSTVLPSPGTDSSMYSA
jgi:hypothetical protein